MSSTTLATYRLFVLGRVDLTDSSGASIGTVLAQPRRIALLAFLAAHRGGVCRRDQLLGMFWPEADESRARKALNKSLHFLRQALGDDAVISRGAEDIEVNQARLWCDARAFASAAEAGAPADALPLYHGDLLPAFYIEDAPAFERWVDSERSHLRRLASRASNALAHQHEREGRIAAAIATARQAVELSDDDERSFRQLLEMLDRLGDRAGALYAYDRFARRLAADLDAEPAPETRALIERVRARTNVAAEALPSPPPPPTPSASQLTAPTEPPSPKPAPRTRMSRYAARAPVGLAGLASVAILASMLGGRPVLTPPGHASDAPQRARVIVAPFVNETGDRAVPDVGTVIAGWVQDALTETGALEITDFRTLTIQPPRPTALTAIAPTDLKSLADAAGAGLVVHGSVVSVGDSIEVRARIIDARAGTVRVALPPVRTHAGAPMAAADQVAQRAAGALAGMFNAGARLSLQGTRHVPTYAAYREFSAGIEKYQTDIAASVDHFKEAIARDSAFFAPKLWLTQAYRNLAGRPGTPSRESVNVLIEALYHRRAEGSDLDRAVLDYLRAVRRGDFEKEIAAMRKAAAVWPDRYTTNIANSLVHDGRPREAIAVLNTVDPTKGFLRGWGGVYWLIYFYANLLLEDFEGAATVARKAQQQFPGRTGVLCFEGVALVGRGQVAKADSLMNARLPGAVASTGGRDEAECWLFLARTAAYFLPADQRQPILESALRYYELPVGDPAMATNRAATAAAIAMWMGDTARFGAYYDSLVPPRAPTRATLLTRSYARALLRDRSGSDSFRSAALEIPTNPDERGLTEQWLARIELALGNVAAAARHASDAHRKGASADRVHLDPALRQLRGNPVFEAIVER